MTWPCFYCTYDNEDDSATQCLLCGMPGNRTKKKAPPKTEDEERISEENIGGKRSDRIGKSSASSFSSESTAIDLTSPDKPTTAFSSKRKRNDPTIGANEKRNEDRTNNHNSGSSNNNMKRLERNFHPSLAQRKPPPRPKVQQKQPQKEKQSTLSFASVFQKKSQFSHGHVFAHKAVALNDPIRKDYKAKMQTVLKNVFGLESLRRNLQPAAIQCAMEGKSQMIVMATGGGKSLCYQLPACLLGGVTVVISPLLALMKDQTEALQSKGIPANCINSSQTEKENKAILGKLVPALYPVSTKAKNTKSADGSKSSHPAVLLYVTPESIQTERMRAVLKTLYKEDRLSLFAVDEAHCLSTWGHDFRSSYRKLNYLRTTFPKTPCMALTATATPKVIKDITNELALQTCPLHIGSFDRPNIFYKVKYKDSLDNPLEELIKYVKGRHSLSGKQTSNENSDSNGDKNEAEECSGIIYVHKREDTYMIARAISKAGITASPYHAGLKKADRATVQEGWSSGKIQVAVATVAFGMGIDRHCVRYVVHWSLPKTIEGFYQEAGRAGRDGLPSHSLVFYSPEDVGKYKYLIRMQGNKSGKGAEAERLAEKNIERKLEQLELMQDYCTQLKCRRNTLIKHFGGKSVDCQKTCDYCRNPKKVERSLHASSAIKDVRRQQNMFGKNGGRKSKGKQAWNGQWDKPHGDDEAAIADDWGDNCLMAGDLRVTGPLGVDFEDYSSSSKTGGFTKASDILSKYESMEGKHERGNGNGFFGSPDEPPRKKPRSINIPEHLKKSLKAASDFTTANNILPPKKKQQAKPLTSTDHANKAKEIEERLNKMKAEREKRLKSLQAKTAKKPPPPPPAPLSFGRRK